jgi:hypothetical protein
MFTDDAIRSLQESVKKKKLTNFDGESVEHAVSLLCGAKRHLKNTQMGAPMDSTLWVLNIFQTLSFAAFNSWFALNNGMFSLGRQKVLATAPCIKPMPTELYCLAEKTYLELCATGSWTGVSTKGIKDPVGLVAGGQSTPRSPPTCWNCGEVRHTFPTCPNPKNESCIARYKMQACKDRKKGGGNPKNKVKNANKKQGDTKDKDPKWASHTSEENNKSIIDAGTLHVWSPCSKCWYVDKHAILKSTQVPQPAPASAPPATPGPSGLTFQQLAPIDTSPDRLSCFLLGCF